MSRHTWWTTGEWGKLAAKCKNCGQVIMLDVDGTFNSGKSLDESIQLLMDRHCVPNAHAEKVVRQGYIGGSRTPYCYELNESQ